MKDLSSIHCILIDDDEEEIEIFKMALLDLALPVTCSTFINFSEALTAITSKSILPDCIFLDLHMGKTTGRECLINLKSNKMVSDVPVVILSGSNNELEIINLKTLGAQEFMVKAESIPDLKNALHSYFTENYNLISGSS